MRWINTGVDADGRSCIVSEGVVTAADGGTGSTHIFSMTEHPPLLAELGSAQLLHVPLKQGMLQWVIVPMAPEYVVSMHQTETIDFDTVLSGSLALELGDGVHHLNPGDCVVMNGVDHAWRAGPEGCVLAAAMIGGRRP